MVFVFFNRSLRQRVARKSIDKCTLISCKSANLVSLLVCQSNGLCVQVPMGSSPPASDAVAAPTAGARAAVHEAATAA